MSKGVMAEQLEQQLPATRNLHESFTRAEELAVKRKHAIVGLDHLLLALGQDPEAVAVLLVCNVDVEALCRDLLRKLGPEARLRNPNTVPPTFDVTVQNLIAHASAAALQANQTDIDGANILSAIISGEGGMITHKILQKHGLTYNETVLNLENKNIDRNVEPQRTSDQSKKTDGGEANLDKANSELTESYNIVANSTAPKAPNQNNEPAPKAALKDQKQDKNRAHEKSEDTIVQAEARPEDYGLTVEGREYSPVPPQTGQKPPLKPVSKEQGKQGAKNQQHPPLPHKGQPSGQKEPHRQMSPQALPPQNRKVSFKEPGGDGKGPEQRDQANNNYIQEDKYGSVPPTPPLPQGGDERASERPRSEITNDGLPPLSQKPSFLNEGLKNVSEAERKINTPHPHQPSLTAPPLAGPPPVVEGRAPLKGQQNFPPNNLEGQSAALNQTRGLEPLSPSVGLGHQQGQQPHPPQNSSPLETRQKGAQGIQGAPVAPGAPQSVAQTQMQMDELAGSISQSQKAQVALNDQDQVVENIPNVMRVGKVHFLEVRVARFTNTEIELAPEDYGLRSKQNTTPITKAITVRLTGQDGQFLIDCATASTQWTEMQGGMTNDADYAVWRWRVMPRKSGASKLRLDITARTSNEDGLTAEIPIQPSKSIDVKVTKNYSSFFKKAVIIAGFFAIGFGISQYGQQAYDFVDDSIKEFSRKD